MARTRKGYVGGAKATTIPGSLNDSDTTITAAASGLTSWAGATTNGPSEATINQGKTDEEVVTFTGISGNDLTGVTRGAAGTSAQAHTAGATLEHTSSVTDFDEANELVSAMANNSVRVYNSIDYSIADNTLTVLTFDSERWDGNTMHSTSANTGRLTAKVAGKYLIFANVQWDTSAAGDRMVAIRLNGTTTIAKQQVQPATTATLLTVLDVTTIYNLSVNDYVDVQVYQNSGGPLAIHAVGNYSPEFGMSFIGF